MDDLNIGKKVQAFRKMRNIKLKELAEITGITASMLSQIERDLVNPSINSLKLIAKALGVPIFLFFKADDQKDLVVRKDKRKTISHPDEQEMVYELLTPDVTGNIEFCMMHIPPLKTPAGVALSHEGEEVAHVIEGSVEIIVSNERYALQAGDSIRIPAHSEHKWENKTKKMVKVVFAVSPPSF